MGPHLGMAPKASFLRTTKRLATRTEAGGTLRIHSERQPRRVVPLRRPPRSSSVQSLPEKYRVLCPPGTQPFRGLFSCTGASRRILSNALR
jgi:hypothetical protein